jgi:hypothetical protein
VAEIVEFPVVGGGVLRVQAADGLGEDGDELVPATGIGEAVQRARESLNDVVGSVTPALAVVTRQLRRLAPDEMTVEFGLLLGAEHGVVVAKGKGEVHFTVTLAWKSEDGPAAPKASEQAAAITAGVGGLSTADPLNITDPLSSADALDTAAGHAPGPQGSSD